MFKIRRITESNDISRDIDLVRDFLSDLSCEYPLHDYWFDEVAKRIEKRSLEREILFVLNRKGVVIAVAILKNTNNEQKICTLKVAKKYQRRHIGYSLVKMSCELLNNSKPIISVSANKRKEFLPLFEKLGFVETGYYINKYRENSLEYCYNGYLSPETILTKDIILKSKTKLKKTA